MKEKDQRPKGEEKGPDWMQHRSTTECLGWEIGFQYGINRALDEIDRALHNNEVRDMYDLRQAFGHAASAWLRTSEHYCKLLRGKLK